MNPALYSAAMWVSEVWHQHYLKTGALYARAKCVVIHDRILTGRVPP